MKTLSPPPFPVLPNGSWPAPWQIHRSFCCTDHASAARRLWHGLSPNTPVIKAQVDRYRRPGRFLLTGSANVLLLPTLADSLAGRLEAQRLHPLAQCELARRESGFLQALLARRFPLARHERLGPELSRRIVAGGYPAALARQPGRRRDGYRAYVQTLVQRDVRDLARIGSLDAVPRLLEFAAGQTAHLMNITIPDWHPRCCVWTLRRSTRTAHCSANCWKPLYSTSCAARPAGAPTTSRFTTSATGTTMRSTSFWSRAMRI